MDGCAGFGMSMCLSRQCVAVSRGEDAGKGGNRSPVWVGRFAVDYSRGAGSNVGLWLALLSKICGWFISHKGWEIRDLFPRYVFPTVYLIFRGRICIPFPILRVQSPIFSSYVPHCSIYLIPTVLLGDQHLILGRFLILSALNIPFMLFSMVSSRYINVLSHYPILSWNTSLFVAPFLLSF